MIVLYSAIFGGSDSVKRPPAGPDRCVLITDQGNIVAPGWEVEVRPKATHPRRAARIVKMSPALLFPEATASVWADGSIAIRDWPLLIADAGDAEAACLAHPDRTTCYDEGRVVIRLERANPSKVNEALALYRAEGFAPTALSTTGLLYRRHTERVLAMNAMWRDHLDRFGINDQVHMDFCAWKSGVAVKHLTGHYRDNPYAVYDRADHHARRRPQYAPTDRCDHFLADA